MTRGSTMTAEVFVSPVEVFTRLLAMVNTCSTTLGAGATVGVAAASVVEHCCYSGVVVVLVPLLAELLLLLEYRSYWSCSTRWWPSCSARPRRATRRLSRQFRRCHRDTIRELIGAGERRQGRVGKLTHSRRELPCPLRRDCDRGAQRPAIDVAVVSEDVPTDATHAGITTKYDSLRDDGASFNRGHVDRERGGREQTAGVGRLDGHVGRAMALAASWNVALPVAG